MTSATICSLRAGALSAMRSVSPVRPAGLILPVPFAPAFLRSHTNAKAQRIVVNIVTVVAKNVTTVFLVQLSGNSG